MSGGCLFGKSTDDNSTFPPYMPAKKTNMHWIERELEKPLVCFSFVCTHWSSRKSGLKSEVQGSLPCTSTQRQVLKYFQRVRQAAWAWLSVPVKSPGERSRTGCVASVLVDEVQGSLPGTYPVP